MIRQSFEHFLNVKRGKRYREVQYILELSDNVYVTMKEKR